MMEQAEMAAWVALAGLLLIGGALAVASLLFRGPIEPDADDDLISAFRRQDVEQLYRQGGE